MNLKIVLIGAGSKEFGPATIRDILLSDHLTSTQEMHLCLMDLSLEALHINELYAQQVAKQLNRSFKLSTTTRLEEALEGADYVISAIEINRYNYWSQDFHIPRKYGFTQVYGENGGIGGLFHALRNFTPTFEIIKKMEQICPNAWLLNYTNPLTKLCELISRRSKIKFVGLCHGLLQGKEQVATFLEKESSEIVGYASGINHFSWFHTIEDLEGNDLYPELKKREREAQWFADWDEIALSRIMLRVFGLFPSPGTNHIGEYVRWASSFYASQHLQFFHDPVMNDLKDKSLTPTYLYNLNTNPTHTPFYPDEKIAALYPAKEETNEICSSGELAIPIIEGLACNVAHELGAINILNSGGYVPSLPTTAIVEVPATVNSSGISPIQMEELPTACSALLHTQTSINKLLVEAYTEKSKTKLLQAALLDPTVDSYSNAVHCINELCEAQKNVLPVFKW